LLIQLNNKKLSIKLEEEIKLEIGSLQDVIKELKILKKENKLLKKKVQQLEKENQINQTKLDLNLLYNSFDINAYKLENIFEKLKSKIIKNREDLGLINRGIKYLFNNNIIYLQNKYISNNEEQPDITNIKNLLDSLDYSLIIILTKDRRRFGAFINNKKAKLNNGLLNPDNNNINNNNLMNNNNMMMNINNMMNNNMMNNNNNMMYNIILFC
jgi:hypothetical protein